MATAYLPQHRQTHTKWLVAIGLTVTLGFCVICTVVFDAMGRRDYDQARQSAVNVTAAISSDIERTFELYDLSLIAVAEGLDLPEIWQLTPTVRQMLLFDRAATAKHLGAIVVLDRTGRVILNSRDENPGVENKSGREYFNIHKMHDDVGLYISQPSVNRKGEYVLNISRRMSAPDGSFNGVIVGSVELSLFHDLFKQVNVRENDTLTLTLRNGTVVMRSPFKIEEIGMDISQSLPFLHMLRAPEGTFESTSQINGIKRLYAYQLIKNVPLYLSYGQSVSAIFKGWWHDAWIVSAIVLLLCVSNVGLIIFLARTLKKQSIAEYNLSLSSVIDSLTDLFNRRKFDEVLEQEWSRAARNNSPLAALMIDADNFKAFNDQFGHQAGDAALKNLADCIKKSALRSTDLCARYGGEEFVVVLPGFDSEQARNFAERVRENVLSLRRQQLQGDLTPTVSIGVASITPVLGVSPSILIEAADAALYQAKLRGRNCVVLAQAPPMPPQAQLNPLNMVA